MQDQIKISIVIPVFNEEKNISILARQIEEALASKAFLWECIWVDDGSSDNSWNEIVKLQPIHRGVRLSRNSGQATAIMAGVEQSQFDLIVTMDSDLQNDPSDIVKLLDQFDDNLDVVCGVRFDRHDKFLTRKFPSQIANWLARKITKVPVISNGSSRNC